MRLSVLVLILFGATVLLNSCQTHATRSTSGGITVRTPSSTASVVFSDRDRQIINEYYTNTRAKKVPPGIAKRDNLPPGLAKQVVRNGSLPPGLQGRVLPLDLETQLSQLPDGHAREIIGADIAILNTTTQVVTDVIKDIVVH